MHSSPWFDRPRRPSLVAGIALSVLVVGGCATGFSAFPEPSPEQIPELEARRSSDPSDVDVLVQLGAAYRSAGRPADAVESLERARSVAPDDPMAVVLLGLTYEDLERWSAARDLYATYLELAPESRIEDRLRGRIRLVRRREFEELVRDALATEASLADEPASTTLAVFPFRYQGEDPELAPLGHALAGMVTTDLSQSSRFTLLERLHVDALMSEIDLVETGVVDPATAARSGRLLGAGRVVQGSFGGDESRIDLNAAVVQVTSGTPDVDPVTRADALERIFDMEKELVFELFETMGVTLTAAERERVLERRTDNLQALLAYGRGLEAAHRGDYEAAAQHFSEAASLDPDFEAARVEASEAEEISAAATTDTGELTRQAMRDVEIPDVREAVAVVDAAVVRNPAQEVLRTEGVSRVILVEVVIRPPGGGG